MTIHIQENVRCGDDWQFQGPITDPSGNPLPLTGATFLYNLDSLDGKTNFYTSTTVTVVNPTTATVFYAIPKATTATIPPGTYYDTLQVTLAGGSGAFTVIEGLINAAPLPLT